MTVKKVDQDLDIGKNDGKVKQDLATRSQKMPSKYTLWRSKDDVKNIDRVRRSLNTEFNCKSYVADSKVYQDLPNLYLNAVKTIHQLQLQLEELTAKLDNVDQIRTSFCRIFELCGVEK